MALELQTAQTESLGCRTNLGLKPLWIATQLQIPTRVQAAQRMQPPLKSRIASR